MLLLGPTDSHIIIHNRENQSKERQLASRQGSWGGRKRLQGRWKYNGGGQWFSASLSMFLPGTKNWVWLSGDDLDLEREQNSMRLESVFMQVKSRYISDNHASRALRCFKKNCACCHWSRGLKVTFDVRSSAKKGGWQGLCRGSRIVQGNWKYSGGGQGFSASLSVSIPLGLECEFLQGLSKILLSLAPKRKPKQLQHSPLEQV